MIGGCRWRDRRFRSGSRQRDQVAARLGAGHSYRFCDRERQSRLGFPSPDSDCDCRFVYIRPVEHHLALATARDVTEFPIVGDIDTGGWDLRKALLLALKGNAVVVEWLKSPIAYEEEAGFRSRLGALLDLIMVPEKVAAHYIGLMRQHFKSDSEGAIKLKKLLYAVRPRPLRSNGCGSVRFARCRR
ncbi:hypothetical protein HJA97_17385 [Rhizobium binae]|nr:nucleotidyltransferase domain-containing protein [Rhizobium binae]MBX4926779.1 hypothetical protein [Rhizobium binae]MBX4939243.1 hypothetical protein [Rhizobium binae]MBX4945761.1 hypothetical protein [Rhizobium binae]MBX4981206.1 hypothetical protein [Rhizobium binae]MBX4990943.1 hypothetical protein [Rhizobium binae]